MLPALREAEDERPDACARGLGERATCVFGDYVDDLPDRVDDVAPDGGEDLELFLCDWVPWGVWGAG